MSATNTNTTTARVAALNFAAFVPAKQLREAFNATAQHNVLQGRVCPKCAEFLGAALKVELSTKTAEFIKSVNQLMAQAAPKLDPMTKLCEALRFAHEWATLLRECSKSKSLPPMVALPDWASEAAVNARAEAKAAKAAATKAAKKAEEISEAVQANAEAEALATVAASAAAEAKAEAKADSALAAAVALIVANASALTEEQRGMLTAALAATEPAML